MATSFDTKGVRGQVLKTGTGRDDSSYPVNDKEAFNGRKMGGSVTNIGHSLSGASAVQHVDGDKGSDPAK